VIWRRGHANDIAEPTFIASLNGLCGFILEVEDGEVDAFTPSGDLLGVFHDRIEASRGGSNSGCSEQPLQPLLRNSSFRQGGGCS
jgi:hypothetical protein